jgi:4-amino-4-deoxy-L-arabinose transferase-like glycosyltransferase
MMATGRRFWYGVIGVLLIPAFVVNLGVVPFIEDESIRALVALEMMLKGDYLVPTLNDSLYFAKPPLYNWILIASYRLLGDVSEWSSRLPTVVFTLAMAYAVYRSSRPYFRDHHTAILAGLMWLTCGRVLFYDSFLGLIDICYSLVIYAIFMSVWHLGTQRRWWLLFALAYGLAGVAYLLKGLPIILFMPCTLLAFAVVSKSGKWLMHPGHLLGLTIGATIVGGYYYLYAQAAPMTKSLGGLSQQATMRTPLSHDIGTVIKHVVTYPMEYIYHYLPWTLFLILAVRRDMLQRLREQPFFLYVAVLFMVNILVYWVSPGTYARYVLMLVPLTYLIGLFFYEKADSSGWQIRVLRTVVMALVVILPVAALAGLWHPDLRGSSYNLFWVSAIAVVLGVFGGYYVYQCDHRPIILVAVLLTLRIGLNIVVLPSRAATTYGSVAKEDAQRIGLKYLTDDVRLYEGSKLDYTSSFYLASTREVLTTRDYDGVDTGVIYIVDTSRYAVPPQLTVIDSIKKREARQTLYLARR